MKEQCEDIYKLYIIKLIIVCLFIIILHPNLPVLNESPLSDIQTRITYTTKQITANCSVINNTEYKTPDCIITRTVEILQIKKNKTRILNYKIHLINMTEDINFYINQLKLDYPLNKEQYPLWYYGDYITRISEIPEDCDIHHICEYPVDFSTEFLLANLFNITCYIGITVCVFVLFFFTDLILLSCINFNK